MFIRIRSIFLSVTIIAVLLFSAVGTTTVYADNGTTTDTTTTDTTGGEGDGSSEESTAESQPTSTAEPVVSSEESTAETATTDTTGGDGSTEESATEPQATVTAETSVSAEENTADTTTVETSILEQVPENTTVEVLGADGQPQPLASQDSANAIATTTDPFWCSASQTTPAPGATGCTGPFMSFDALLTELSTNPTLQGAGTIYVEQGSYAGGESSIDFNSYNLSNISNSALTIQGGWNLTTGSVTSTSNFTVPIIIGSSANPWGGSLTIDSIIIDNSSETGLTVYSQSDITVSNVQSTNSVNGSGAELDAGGNVTIRNSTFDRNEVKGANIKAGGNVAISNSSFSITGTNRRQLNGADIVSGGSVSLFDVIANGNREVGVNITANGRVSIGASFIGGSSFSDMKSMTNTTCPGNGVPFCGYGLMVTTPDSIDLQGVVGNNNFLWGANLNAGQDVNIVDSIFNANSTEVPTFIDDTGVFITAGGNVSLNNVTANDNRLYGASIDAVGNININNSRFLSNNGETVSGAGVTTFHGMGILATSDNSIFINTTEASGNSLFGANLNAAGDVAIANSFFNNTTTGSATDALGVGLQIVSGKNVFIDTVTLDGNQLSGAIVQAAGDAFLDFITATNNGTNGMEVDASCTFLNGGTFTGNGQYGLSLVNPLLNQVGSPVFSGNGAGDIFPPAPASCAPAFVIGGNTGNTNTGNGITSNEPQLVSLATMSSNNSKGMGLINSGAITLENLFANNYQLFGVSTSLSGDVTTLGMFTGKYAYIHSANGLEIVLLVQPTFYTNVWSSDAS